MVLSRTAPEKRPTIQSDREDSGYRSLERSGRLSAVRCEPAQDRRILCQGGEGAKKIRHLRSRRTTKSLSDWSPSGAALHLIRVQAG